MVLVGYSVMYSSTKTDLMAFGALTMTAPFPSLQDLLYILHAYLYKLKR